MNIDMYLSSNRCESIFHLDSVTLKFLSMQTAACVIAACKTYPTESIEPLTSEIGIELSKHVSMAPYGYTNFLQTQAEFLLSIFKYIVESKVIPWLIEGDTIGIIVEALTVYQGYKTRICERDEVAYGKGFGSATDFYKVDWRRYNAEVMSLYQERTKRVQSGLH